MIFEQRLVLPRAQLDDRLAKLPGAFRLCDEGRVFAGALPVETSTQLDPKGSDTQGGAVVSDWPEWVGVLPYEAFRAQEGNARSGLKDARPEPLVSSAIWRRYEAIVEVGSEGLVVKGFSNEAVARLVGALGDEVPAEPPAKISWAAPPEDGSRHRDRVRVALDRIAQGSLYQVNLARRFHFHVEGHPLSVLSSLGPLAHAPFAAALDLGEVQVVSTSPELFLAHSSDGRVTTRPIKGTRPRSDEPREDERLSRELDASEKERAELAMVIDIERNDLGRLAVPGSVQMTELPHVVSHPTVHHREATIVAQLAPGTTRIELLEATMPSGSVTGAPKVAAMRLIAELEAERRGLYTGALGYITHGGAMRLSMAIRVLTMKGDQADYYAGGGIVADSDPEQELQETRWKAEQLRALVKM